MSSTSLITHNTLFIIGAALNLGVLIFVLISSRKKINTSVVMFSLMTLSVFVYQISHLLGINASTAEASKNILMFNLSTIFIEIFMTHWFLSITGKVQKRKIPLIAIYTSGIALFAFFVTNPQFFLVNSIPKLYLPFYYQPGPFFVLVPIWFFITGLYYFYELDESYRSEINPIQKNRLKYVLASILYAFIVGTTAYLLVFDIPFDPVYSAFFGLYTIPIAYAIIRYELLDIRIFARRAIVYVIVMFCLGIGIGTTNLIGNYIATIRPDFPVWMMPAILAILIGESGFYLWRKARQEDRSKYEFVNLVTHKFRGPLTQIKWGTDLIESESANLSDNIKNALDNIQEATSKMVELTSALVTLNDTDAKKYSYNYKSFNLLDVVNSVVAEYGMRFSQKQIDIGIYATGVNTTAYGDPEKIRFAVNILLNNALTYTPTGGKVSVRFWERGNNLELSIIDNGIGIPEDAGPFIFNKFFRAENARRVTVDGTGIGLYLANEIVKLNGGTLSYFSQGPNKGSTFVVHLPNKI